MILHIMSMILGGGGRDQILDPPPPPIKYQISPIRKKNQVSGLKIRYQISDPKKNQLSDTTPPKKSNIRYQGTCGCC